MGTNQTIEAIASSTRNAPTNGALLIALTGIDGSGKTTVAKNIVAGLKQKNLNAVLIGLDAWHNPPEIRSSQQNPAEHFYHHAFRFDELFERLISPLRRDRAIRLAVNLTRLPQNDIFEHTYDFKDVDLIVLEGIFLLKRELRANYDLAYWVDCSFETALARAILRNQEGLSYEELINDYNRIYFPARRLHFARDDPKSSVRSIIANDRWAKALSVA